MLAFCCINITMKGLEDRCTTNKYGANDRLINRKHRGILPSCRICVAFKRVRLHQDAEVKRGDYILCQGLYGERVEAIRLVLRGGSFEGQQVEINGLNTSYGNFAEGCAISRAVRIDLLFPVLIAFRGDNLIEQGIVGDEIKTGFKCFECHLKPSLGPVSDDV